MFVYIPARIGSKRIPKKNIKLLDGKPLILHVIDNLLGLDQIKGIAVSTDSIEIKDMCDNIDKVVTLELRDNSLADDHTGFAELIRKDLPRYCDYFNEDTFMFCLPTAVLVNSEIYMNAIKKYLIRNEGILISGIKYQISPFLAIEKKGSDYSPLFPSCYSMPTDRLPETFVDSGCFYILKASSITDNKNMIDIRPIIPFILEDGIGIDLDTLDDWEKLKIAFNYKNKISNFN